MAVPAGPESGSPSPEIAGPEIAEMVPAIEPHGRLNLDRRAGLCRRRPCARWDADMVPTQLVIGFFPPSIV